MGNSGRDETIRLNYDFGGTEAGRALASTLTDIANGSTAAAPAAQALIEQLNKLDEQSGGIDKLISLKSALGETDIKLQAATKSVADLNNEFDRTDTSNAKVNAAFAKAEAQVAALTKQHNALQAQIASTSGTLEKAGVDTEHLDSAQRTIGATLASTGEKAQALAKSAGEAGKSHKELADATQHAGEKAHEAGTAFEFVREHLKEIITVATAVEVALKGIEFGRESLKNAESVEASLSRVKALAVGAAEQFEGMDEAVEKAARAVNTTTENAAAGLGALAAQGLTAKDAIAALVPTLQLAKIANVDVNTAAGEVAQTLKAFNLPASEAQRVVDELTAASHGAAGGLAAMSNAAAQLAPDAKTLGLSFTQTVSILGLLESKGLDTEKAVRGLRTVFQELENPTSKLRVELLALGDGSKDFDKAVAALSANTPRAREALLTLSGPARTLVEVLGQAGPNAIATFNAKLQESQGIAERTAHVLDDNLKGAATRFSNAIGEIGEKLAKPVLEPFKLELEKLGGELNKFAESPDFKEIEAQIGDMARNAARAIDEFLHGIDWKTFLGNAKDALGGVVEDLKSVADSAISIATAVNKSADIVGTAWHTAAGAVHTAASVVSEAVGEVAEKAGHASESIAHIAGVSDEVAKHVSELGRTFKDVAAENIDSAGKSFGKAGADLKELAGASDKAAAAAHEHGNAVADAGRKTADFSNVTSAASTQTSQFAAKMKEAGDHTKSLADRLTAAHEALALAGTDAERAAAKLDILQGAFTGLSIKSQQDLQTAAEKAKSFFEDVDKYSARTAAGLADRQNAFIAYAKTALAAAENLDEGTRDSVRYQLDAQASSLGLVRELEKLHGVGKRAGESVAEGARAAAQELKQEAAAAKEAGESMQAFASRGTDALGYVTQALANTRAGFLGVSQAAADLFDKNLAPDATLIDAIGTGFDALAERMASAQARTTAAIEGQRIALADEAAAINKIGTDGSASMARFGETSDQTLKRLQDMDQALKSGSYDAGLLGRQELGPLQSSIEGAIQRTQALINATKSAKDQFAALAQSAQDAFDQASGNVEGQENNRHKKQLADLEAAAKTAGELNSSVYRHAVENENKLHDLNMKHIAEQSAAKQQANAPAPSPAASGNSANAGGGSNGASAGTAAPAVGTIYVNPTINLGAPHKPLASMSDQEVNEFSQRIIGQIAPELTYHVIYQLQLAKGRA